MIQFSKNYIILSFFHLMTFTLSAGKLIISDRGAGSIKITNFDGSSSEVLIPSAGTNVRGIATDLSMGIIFYADNGSILSTKQKLMDRREQPSFNLGLDSLPISQLIDSQKKSTGVIEIMIE